MRPSKNNHRTNGKRKSGKKFYICLADSNCDPGNTCRSGVIPLPVLAPQTAFRGISYRPLMAFVMFSPPFLSLLLAYYWQINTQKGYYLKTIAFGIVIGMLFHGMGVNLLLNMNHWLASRLRTQRIQSNRNVF